MKIQRLNSFIIESNIEKVLDLKDVFLELKDDGIVTGFNTTINGNNANIKITIKFKENIFSNIKDIDVLSHRIKLLKTIDDNLKRVNEFFTDFSFKIYKDGIDIIFSPNPKFKEFYHRFKHGALLFDKIFTSTLHSMVIDNDLNCTFMTTFKKEITFSDKRQELLAHMSGRRFELLQSDNELVKKSIDLIKDYGFDILEVVKEERPDGDEYDVFYFINKDIF